MVAAAASTVYCISSTAIILLKVQSCGIQPTMESIVH